MEYFLVSGLAEAPVLLAENEFFLLGDNGESSEDSRFATVGNIKRDDLCGKVWFRISPFKNIGSLGK